MAEESDGTNSYFKLIGIVKEVLDEGTPLVVDELDAHLHPPPDKASSLTF